MSEFLIDILKIIPFAIMPYFWGLDDGLMKKNGTEAHWPKWIIFAFIGYINIYFFFIGFNSSNVTDGLTSALMSLLGWALMWKPLFDKGWSTGRGFKKLHLGDHWIDQLVSKLGKFIPAFYFFLVAGGILLMRHFG